MAAAFTALLRRGGPAAPPAATRCLCLAGLPAPADAEPGRRAPRQAELLEMLRNSPRGLAREVLEALGWDHRPVADALVRKGWAVWKENEAGPFSAPVAPIAEGPRLTAHQETALAAIVEGLDGYRGILLEGVTGSGKTEVYLRAAQEVLARGRQVMILLPEISLTPQLEARFRARFEAPVAVFHSGLPDGERRRSWLAMQRGEAAILLGTRSAVFTPMRSPGLFILDEEHDSSYKQQDGFRFSARDVAVMRARLTGVPVILGSATPSLETLSNAARGRYRLLQLPERTGSAGAPRFRLLNIRGRPLTEGLSAPLVQAIGETLGRGEQALVFVNRRGFAPTLICHACGFVAECSHCDANLVVHVGERRLRCHHCGQERPLPRNCPACGGTELHPLGLGTERVEAALAALFPNFRLARLDRDSIRSRSRLEKVLEDIREGRADILVGTQMLAKGHHFPGITLVGIVDVDAGLYSIDFRAEERTAQLIVQVAGRAGREDRPGTVILQTRHPDHPLLQALVRDGYGAFARAALAERQAAGLPPYSHQALWRAEARDTDAGRRFLAGLAAAARADAAALRVLGPAPAPLARRSGRYRWQLLVQSGNRGALHSAMARLRQEAVKLDETRKVRWSIDVDPMDLF
jgi:primosomal protein N' (replication factor Y)